MDGLLLKYFVLRPKGSDAHAEASRMAMKAYATVIRETNAALSDDLLAWVKREQIKEP